MDQYEKNELILIKLAADSANVILVANSKFWEYFTQEISSNQAKYEVEVMNQNKLLLSFYDTASLFVGTFDYTAKKYFSQEAADFFLEQTLLFLGGAMKEKYSDLPGALSKENFALFVKEQLAFYEKKNDGVKFEHQTFPLGDVAESICFGFFNVYNDNLYQLFARTYGFALMALEVEEIFKKAKDVI